MDDNSSGGLGEDVQQEIRAAVVDALEDSEHRLGGVLLDRVDRGEADLAGRELLALDEALRPESFEDGEDRGARGAGLREPRLDLPRADGAVEATQDAQHLRLEFARFPGSLTCHWPPPLPECYWTQCYIA